MNHIKCLNISQVSQPTETDVPRLIWVASGELYADIAIAGKPERLKISDIITADTLPDNPRISSLYFSNGRFQYYDSVSWFAVATLADLTYETEEKTVTIADLFTYVFDADNGMASLSSAVSDLTDIILGTDDVEGLTAVAADTQSRVAVLEQKQLSDDQAIEELTTKADTASKDIQTNASAISSLAETVTAQSTKLSEAQSAISDATLYITEIQKVDATQDERLTNIEASLGGVLQRLEAL